MIQWLTWPLRMVQFAGWFAWQLVLSNVAVIKDNITPGQDSTPGIVELRTQCRTDAEITALGALITLTPGTLTLGTDIIHTDDGPTRLLFVHGMYAQTAKDLRASLHDMEHRMLHSMRRKGFRP
ncbi:Na+/H+ antiporter subunit E [Jonesia denitrificans]|uniref:Cation antiporter n=1 Tax=Jonesia denitrificans (strain ATCC 14870 / DSM 20603 / BCRC 15368 / CIP 55.134 / JCM 11481 / NBRC 15587 / NCTC 10816 / Prevot 55134) TaxID=471856 RepID=C7R001_JONDD|nr:Na+/H+ antiporter subunit E [Jonesia denitrificans]ACV09559.1 cation antiporter [Jonesia denitrificans DSM 20603]ASE09213.1 sodium:proton antiporter [Jonesia denitrificans]QXB43755.1 Na+/H+ antiporter subunit E [Jonesia denitrificans]SQH21976.1 Multiple resistance and pH homeostasis protein E [Jonesia denitrificans]